MSQYTIGIDLGTTHCALSYLNLEEGRGRGRSQAVLPIPQLTAPGTVESRLLLPSFLYLPSGEEFAPGSLGLPWDEDRTEIIGELARSHGSKVPGHLVSSAKSWLCHPGVDRKSALLPSSAPKGGRTLSPLDASARFLQHLREAWDHAFTEGRPSSERALSVQDLVVTVPASFDAAARELTLEAASKAGLPNVVLLEEPQAALYAWLESAGEAFRDTLKVGDVVLVVDVGGGTSDFSLISVVDKAGNLELRRLAVGDHILLGGDNMDLALAYMLSQKLAKDGKKLDSWQLTALTYAARAAKEQLFARDELSAAQVSIASRGASLLGGTLRTELSREELHRVLVEGFFPHSPVGEAPAMSRRTGLAQLGLPYAQDAAITRHLAAFLTRHAPTLGSARFRFVHPTAILFNGGVFKAQSLKQRLLNVLNNWLEADGGEPVKELPGSDLDLSVARGAAYYGWVRKGHGIRIRGGTARAYYVGVETAMPAVPGMEPPVKAVCVAPFGMEEGTQAELPAQEFGLVVGEPTRFRFFSSSVRREDAAGDVLEDIEELEEVAPIQTTLPVERQQPGRLVPVRLQAAVTELGLLELRCLEEGGRGKWKLELNVRMKE